MASKRIVQFGFRPHGNPYAGGPVPVVDCTIIPNPWSHGDRATDEERMERVRQNPKFEGLVQEAIQLLALHDKIGIACLYGKHRSGAVASEVAKRTGAAVEKLKT